MPPRSNDDRLRPVLKIRAERDTEWYAKGVKITDAELAALPLTRHDWHGDWNYTLTATPPA